jgi:hypothetical protein
VHALLLVLLLLLGLAVLVGLAVLGLELAQALVPVCVFSELAKVLRPLAHFPRLLFWCLAQSFALGPVMECLAWVAGHLLAVPLGLLVSHLPRLAHYPVLTLLVWWPPVQLLAERLQQLFLQMLLPSEAQRKFPQANPPLPLEVGLPSNVVVAVLLSVADSFSEEPCPQRPQGRLQRQGYLSELGAGLALLQWLAA